MIDEIKVIKEEEQLKFKEEAKAEMAELEAKAPAGPNIYLQISPLLIVAGLVLLVLMRVEEPWNFWWLIFFAKPFFFGWGWWGPKNRKWGGKRC